MGGRGGDISILLTGFSSGTTNWYSYYWLTFQVEGLEPKIDIRTIDWLFKWNHKLIFAISWLGILLLASYTSWTPTTEPKKLKTHSIGVDLTKFWFSLENFRALSVLEARLGLSWSHHDPDMVPENRHSKEIILGSSWVSLENLRILVKLDQTWSKHGPNMVQTWS